MPRITRRLIVGGVAVNVSQVPFLVRLYTEALGIGFCGGSLLNARTVLTAAHCIPEGPPTLYVGTYQEDVYAANHSAADVVRVGAVAVHPDYDPEYIARGQDVAVLTLERPPRGFGLAGGPRAVVLGDATWWPHLAQQPTDSAYVMGYGARTYGGPQSLYPRAAHVHLYTQAECASYLGFNLTASNLCAGIPNKDSCSGDSGGPLAVAYDGAFVQVGIVSWGVSWADCGDAPGVYSLTSAARTFLLPFNATYVDHAPADGAGAAPCECSTVSACVSNGFPVAPRCGCADHLENGVNFCYVTHDACPNATHSEWKMGALFRACTATEACATRRADYRARQCCGSAEPSCVSARAAYQQAECCTRR